MIKSLAVRNRERGLSTGEKKMLASARQILESELAYALDSSVQEIAALVEKHLCQ